MFAPIDPVRAEFEARNRIAYEQERLRCWPYVDAVERAFYLQWQQMQQLEAIDRVQREGRAMLGAQCEASTMCDLDAVSASPHLAVTGSTRRRTTDVTVNVRITVNGADVPLWKIKELGDLASALGVPLDVSAVPQSPESE
jgi:hypothetical protein